MVAIFNTKQGGSNNINLKLHWVKIERSGTAHSKAETSGSRLHVPRRLANEWMKYEVKSKLHCSHFSETMPKWMANSTSKSTEESVGGDYGGK